MNKDLIFECQFSLSLIKDGYESMNDTIISDIKYILECPQHKSDPRINNLKSEFKNIIKIWGYGGEIDSDEIIDLYHKIEQQRISRYYDVFFTKILQRALILEKLVNSMSTHTYQKYKKYHSYFENIISWIYEVKNKYIC